MRRDALSLQSLSDAFKHGKTHFFNKGDSSSTLTKSLSKRFSLDILPYFDSTVQEDILFKGKIISVSAYDELGQLQKIMSARKYETGYWTRKVSVYLEIGKKYIRELSLDNSTVLAVIPIQDMKFALVTSKNSKRCQFSIHGELPESKRVYEVCSSSELNVWYHQLSNAKNLVLPSELDNPVGKHTILQNLLMDESSMDAISIGYSLLEREDTIITDSQESEFWNEFSNSLQRLKNEILHQNDLANEKLQLLDDYDQHLNVIHDTLKRK
ncbi:hypothetical protein HDV06_000900 [Boothiomyces sp. JEL0866]|nr:hypothetical protein HDV06_000900 [Boothiomyces sp. JEL0866]